MSSDSKISAREFYGEYHGHKVRHLKTLHSRLRETSRRLIFTAGDSSLDNKYWFYDTAPAVAGTAYRDILEPPRSVQDVTYWLNYLCQNNNNNNNNNTNNRRDMAAINTAVEATTLNERTFVLRPQDVFIRDNIQEQDILIVSVGGNDVALCPLPCTIASMAGLMCCVPSTCIEKGYSCGTVPLDDCCCGCGPSLCSCACTFPPCLGYFRHLFGTRIEHYIKALTVKTKPSKILVCMIYYPDEENTPGWAGPALGALGYNTNPAKLQLLIRKAYQDAISKIHIQGTEVIPVPLFHALDGKNTHDYVQRVEPSSAGGRVVAEFLLDIIDRDGVPPAAAAAASTGTTVPSSSYIRERE